MEAMKSEKSLKSFFLPGFIILAFAFTSFFMVMSEIRKFDHMISGLLRQVRMNDVIITGWIQEREEAPFFLPLPKSARDRLTSAEENFIEVHLEKMTTGLYEKGVLKEEYPILARGNDRYWGGSPAGLYKVEAKYSAAFSVSSRVYMPFSIHYYGKYYLHGIPYYPNGSKLISRFSGGCLRYEDKIAEMIFSFAKEGMPLIVIDSEGKEFEKFPQNPKPLPELSSSNYIVADLESGLVLAEKGSLKKMSIASISKMMTAVVISENIGLNRSIEISDEMLEVYGYTPGLESGERYQLIELLYPLLTRSSNQAAEALTGFMGREETLIAMNTKAHSIMMSNTTFSDPSGLDTGNMSTARDLYYLARYIYYNRRPLLEITKNENVPFLQKIRFDSDQLGNKNIFINDPTFIGGKTGYTNASGQTGMFLFNLDYEGSEKIIVMIFLNSKNLKWDTQQSYRWLLDNGFKMI